ncbi:hypothetical protein D1007_14780 [Hordeum vulgare]|nr:hypothetical protein D1007_14780 [Hordeum vulgare]
MAGARRGSVRGFGDRGSFGCRDGFDARGGFAARKRRNDEEAGGSGLRPPMSERQREAAHKHDAESRSVGSKSSALDNFRRLGDIFDLAVQRRREVELKWFQARESSQSEM